MKIKLELDALQGCLDVISRLAPPTSGNITFMSKGGKVTLASSADLSRCLIIMPCEVDKEGEFAIPLQALRDASKGRKELELLYKNAVLNVMSGKYKAELTTVDIIPLDEYEAEEGNDWKLDTKQSSWLKKALRDVALKPTTLLMSWIPVGVKLTPKGAFVACYDLQHMSWTSSKEVTGDFNCVLPLETLTNVIDLFHKSTFKIRHTRSRIEISTKLAKVYLNTPTMDDLPSLDDVQSKIKEASKIDGATFTFSKDNLMVFMDNARSVIGKERAELLVASPKGSKGLDLTIRTGQGQVSASVKGSGKGSFKVDYEYFLEGLGKAGEEVSMNVVQDAFVGMTLATSSLIIALNQ